jgi:hypothetical protein
VKGAGFQIALEIRALLVVGETGFEPATPWSRIDIPFCYLRTSGHNQAFPFGNVDGTSIANHRQSQRIFDGLLHPCCGPNPGGIPRRSFQNGNFV